MNIPNLHKIVDSKPWQLKEIPFGWTQLAIAGQHQSYYQHRSGVIVIASIDTMEDGTVWKHVSGSKHRKNPNWQDMYGIKRVFFGDEEEAIQVFPRHDDMVDLSNCLHLWSKVSNTLP